MVNVKLPPNVEQFYSRDGRVLGYRYRYRVWDPEKQRFRIHRRRLPHPLSPEFEQAYKLARADHFPNGEHSRAQRYTFNHLIDLFEVSPQFIRLKPKTRHDYRQYFKYFHAKIGDRDVREWTRGRVIEMRDANTLRRPRFAELSVKVMSRLMRYAVDLEWREHNPAERIPELKRQKAERQPWPPEFIDAMLQHASGPLLTAILIGLAIGPRAGDLVELRWEQFDGEAIVYDQQKTNGAVYAMLLPDMREYLCKLRETARGDHIVADKRTGRKLSYGALQQRFAKLRKKIGASGYSLHGLRKNATVALAEAGCSNEQIRSITGHETDAMVAHYAKTARRQAYARDAIRKLEQHQNRDGA